MATTEASGGPRCPTPFAHIRASQGVTGSTPPRWQPLLNRLSGADIYAEDQLFATLDPTTRQVQLPNHEPMLMTDTVGFIQKLPHHLVDSFKATLEEVVEADLLVHVIDASHPQVDTQIEAVHLVLEEIGALEKPMLYVFNKIDDEKGSNAARRLERQFPKSASVSALTGEGIDLLHDELADCLKGRKVTMRLSVPLGEGKLIAALQKNASILEQVYEGATAELLVRVSHQLAAQCRPFEVAE